MGLSGRLFWKFVSAIGIWKGPGLPGPSGAVLGMCLELATDDFCAHPAAHFHAISPLVVHHVDVGRSSSGTTGLWSPPSCDSLFVSRLILVFLFQLPYASRNRFARENVSNEKIYYSMTVLDTTIPLPRIQPRGAGAHPDEGQFPHLRPALGALRIANRVFVRGFKAALRPGQSSADDHSAFFAHRIFTSPRELKLPNIVDGMVTAGPGARRRNSTPPWPSRSP